ncbi:MAG: YdhR family protein [Thermodesulfobacteriota bacterium]
MITTITKFKMPKSITREEASDIFMSTAPKYQSVPGLFRKCYFLSEDKTTVGGIYLWNSRAEAEAMYTESWKDFVREKYGSEPSVTYLDTPVVVDNITNEIISDK